MSLRISIAERLLTWLDVERLLKQKTALWSQLPNGVHGIDCFADGMEIRAVEPAVVEDWLSSVFSQAYDLERNAIRLRIAEAWYPVQIIEESSGGVAGESQTYPLWRDVTYLPTEIPEQGADFSNPHTKRWPAVWSASPYMVSFHSFKGGVGRTTALMTYVAACMNEPSAGPKKILVIDADLEAPGVSFWLDEVNRPAVSFVQLLEALHYPPVSTDSTLDFFAEELRKTSLNVSGMQRELFILPAALNLGEIQDMPVAPEHLARHPENPWRLSDHLFALGQRLGVDAVFIDLRAGLSELASPIIFDPRVDHFFVTTVAPQSVMGMAEVLRRLQAFNSRLPAERRDNARPTVVLSLLTKELREAESYERALRILGEAYPAEDALTSGIQWLEAEFLSTLMSISTVREALDVLPTSSRLFAGASEWASGLYAEPDPVLESTSTTSAVSSRQALATKLHDVCKSAQFAESDANASILAIEPLLNLGKHHAKDLPNLLMIGAKGAGKTFTFRQLVRSGKWSRFLERLGFDPASIIEASVFPALWSSNIEDTPDGEIKAAQGAVLDLIKVDRSNLKRGSDLSRLIKDALAQPPGSWEDFWDCVIAQQLGVVGGQLSELNQELVQKSERVIIVFDGIEDAFEDVTNSVAVEAIQALLRLTNRLSELENRHIGAIIFVRADYVQATVRQNLGQLQQRYQPFRLQWNPESFLRLAFMLSCQAGIHGDDPISAESLRVEQLKDKLEGLWGKKLGSEKSKEAHSARWVYAALCDLKGNVQARDLVRFLKFASYNESERSGSTWPDRILSPESMRKAIPSCSQEKVSEAIAEIAPLKAWTQLLKQHGASSLRVPFSQEGVYLSVELLGALQDIGVIYEDLDGDLGDERLFLPEIYRSGLGFDTSATGRPRMQALLKKNIGNIPL
ncbi:ParA family protein [Pseudomonas aeruginosa]|uniref:KGGVGR-motif variant AAA ATPase n=1 Tax=Pseudomonas aeruginosa TaxID=287 RepID=UPI00071CD2CA|nr:hypothetical protein [Pseudomonas aeruginosa]ELK4900814.1 hypothetical protein [Pseudomonas aeruginosa]ELQ9077877.1 hypothetical protein [Pseudomonas aeruginosa]KSE78183.1 ATPase [Pseudomonas aeruginosa]MBH8923877.1 hypothetical protein [Pseudomonas aeruginosa]MBS9738924.1 hypothetical protein [Pseudomonas aeruginosa]